MNLIIQRVFKNLEIRIFIFSVHPLEIWADALRFLSLLLFCFLDYSHVSSWHNLLLSANHHPSTAARHPEKLCQSGHPHAAQGLAVVVSGVSFLDNNTGNTLLSFMWLQKRRILHELILIGSPWLQILMNCEIIIVTPAKERWMKT